MRPRVGVQCGTPTRVSQGFAIVGIYPCGKAREPDKIKVPGECPLSFSPNDLGSVFPVKGIGFASLRSLDCCGPIRGDGDLQRKRRRGGQRLEPFRFFWPVLHSRRRSYYLFFTTCRCVVNGRGKLPRFTQDCGNRRFTCSGRFKKWRGGKGVQNAPTRPSGAILAPGKGYSTRGGAERFSALRVLMLNPTDCYGLSQSRSGRVINRASMYAMSIRNAVLIL